MKAQQEPWLNALGKPRKQKNEELEFDDIPDRMKSAKRWLLWKKKKDKDGKDRKIPHYVNHMPRSGDLDSPEDLAQLCTFEQAVDALQAGFYTGLGFALGGDGTGNYWQGVDLDKITEHPGLEDIADDLPGYTETSPSGKGRHAIGYGKKFGSMGSNGSGVEAYCEGRFFTVTGEGAGLGDIEDIAEFVNKRLAPVHGGQRRADTSSATSDNLDPIPAASMDDLRSALGKLNADDRDLWIRVGMALKTGGNNGKVLWLEWSQSSDKWQPTDAGKWVDLHPSNTHWKSIFLMAKELGWDNPASGTQATGETSELPGYAFDSVKIDRIHYVDYIIKHVINRGEVAVVFGDSGSMKSFVCMDMLFHAVNGWAWRGNKVQPEGCAGLVVLGEGQAGYQKRLAALTKHHSKSLKGSVPIWIVPEPVRLDNGHMLLAAWIEQAEKKLGKEIKVVLMDTLSLMLGDGDESSNADIAVAMNNARAAVGHRTIVLVHHTGHGDKTRERGAYQIRGNADVRILIKRDEGGKGKVITVSSLKSKDDAEFADINLSYQVEVLGMDQDGEDITSVVITDTDLKPQDASTPKGSKPYEYVLEAIRLAGTNSKELVRPHFYSIYPSDSDKTKRNKFAEGWAEYMNKACKAADSAGFDDE